ncbi:MAG: dTDP-4-amino-4,6-dideoxygalactose transaminase [Spirochaetales bacterium]|nr:dTDP-4-amino-4,6-dideoxygalactose transaminase [Spirochaetales bacterium]
MIPFNVPPVTGKELEYINDAIKNHKICGDGSYTKKCTEYLEKRLNGHKVLLTTSCTSALEMAALLCNVKAGDEVILPSFTFCSTADAFVQRGAKLVFVDVRKDTMNIDETKIEEAITSKTKAICVVHYAGVACEMDTIMNIAHKHNLLVVEDAAQAICSYYKGKPLGTIGNFGCLSFHETKNLSMGEGGAIIINNIEDYEKAEIIREKGTDRSKFLRGQIDKYTWRDYGSSYLPSDLNAAYLWAQLEECDAIQNWRMKCWETYYKGFEPLAEKEFITLPVVPKDCIHNAHMFYLITKNIEERTALIKFLKDNDVNATFHYVPLHSSPAGKKYGIFYGADEITTPYSERLVRLPMYYGLSQTDQEYVIEKVCSFFKQEGLNGN